MEKRRVWQGSRVGIEMLESRTLLAGSVTATMTPHGDLIVLGDRAANVLEMTPTGEGTLALSGESGTTVNGQARITLPLTPRHVRITLGGGDDTLQVHDLAVAGALTVHGGTGSDRLHLWRLTIDGQLRIRGGRGADDLHLLQVTSGARTRLSGGRGTDQASLDTVTGRPLLTQGIEGQSEGLAGANAVRTAVASASGTTARALPLGVMEQKLQQSIEALTKPQRMGDAFFQEALDGILEALYTSSLVVLPTAGNDSTAQAFQAQGALTDQAIAGLTSFIGSRPNIGTPEAKALAFGVRNFLEVTREAMQVIAAQTAGCDPQNLGQDDPGCTLLEQDDEGGQVIDAALEGATGEVRFNHEVRSPFPLLFAARGAPAEQVIAPEALSPDECAVVMKEIQGIKAVVTARKIPIWIEPWFARATIVGFSTIWVWEFLPAEFVKHFTFCNVDDGSGGRKVVKTVETQVVLERQLSEFWRFLTKDITAVA